MKILIDVLQKSTTYLSAKGIPNARREAEYLIADVLKMPRLQLYMEHERPLNEDELTTCREWLIRRGKGEPLAYIRGFVEFFECLFHVSPSVLIPRQETEILTAKISKTLESYDLKGKSLIDLCCGSGCIGISLKKKFPELNIQLIDISSEALELAQKNALHNGVQVEIIKEDLLSNSPSADFIVCNPPYISDAEFVELDISVRSYEPKGALIAGPSGLEFYHRLANELPKCIKFEGRVWLEIGCKQGEAVKNIFTNDFWSGCSLEKDWAGHDRFLTLFP